MLNDEAQNCELNQDLIGLLKTTDGIESIKEKVLTGELSIHAVDNELKNDLLFFAVVFIQDDSKFYSFLDFFIKNNGNINHSNIQGFTALDMCRILRNGQKSQAIQSALQSEGGKFGREVSNIQRERATEKILPGFEGFTLEHHHGANLRGFSFEDGALKSVEEHILDPIANTNYLSPEDICSVLKAGLQGIGRLFDEEELISTFVLIKNDWIITARHSVNLREIESLRVVFGNDNPDDGIPIEGVIESGASIGLDYIILKLSRPVDNIQPLILTSDNTSTSLLIMGYNDTDNTLKFSAFPNENTGQLAIVGFQETGAALSGSPYFSLDGQICGLHTRTSTREKTGIYFSAILATKNDSVLSKLINSEDVSNVAAHDEVEYFEEFTGAVEEFGEFDEGKPLRILVTEQAGKFIFSSENRPSNQNSNTVQRKIKHRIQKMQTEGNNLTDVQTRFFNRTDYALKEHKIDIAHNIAISEIRDALVRKMNNPISSALEKKEIKEVQQFSDAIDSSDEETSTQRRFRIKEKLPALVKKIRELQKKPEGMKKADVKSLVVETEVVLRNINRCSKNLMPGHSKVNSSIQDYRDPHLIKNGKDYKETKTSKILSQRATAFFGKDYLPKSNAEGKFQSSSVDSDNDPIRAYYTHKD